MSLFKAINYNYRAINLYIRIINQILSKFSITPSSLKKEDILYTSAILLEFSINDDNVYQLNYLTNFPKENEIDYIIMNDQIEKFREFVTERSLDDILIRTSGIIGLELIEACCYYGSVNIFNFLISNLNQEITNECLEYSFAGGNTDIINECLKYNKIDSGCFRYIVGSHNNKFLEFIFERDLFEEEFLDINVIIESQNLKAVFLLYKKDKRLIMPWRAAFPQTFDIIKNELLPSNRTSPFFK
ncbi:hypothetical protein TVAG_006860 [Trichomonas vaginalis G3]|uniref:DUF3447 domain-containing protein n=1 Tax=Trichomonas vaginalis (strain ATCC PRA-98 / G3) TaxID=412133 RepID=A2FC09_TRIV3|nr:spectrin binding [Trichomonas vaginalis G3]EAX97555.1 hypothetical protein TVAG_006860 [Trichomonas vaginalis G3]KAI5488114.1 spectrin binding [Trichomonas vaginalis G3]|eukprot:XP_001310485.1 hypothetical protein [Trichomonas vaginalis G3]